MYDSREDQTLVQALVRHADIEGDLNCVFVVSSSKGMVCAKRNGPV